MAVAFRVAGSQGSTSGSSLAINYPAPIAAGDLILVQYWHYSGMTPTTPAGYTKLFGPVSQSGGSPYLSYVYYKIAAGTETGSLTISTTGTASGAGGIISVYTGCDTTTPINGYATANLETSGTTGTCPSLTTTVANTMVLHMYFGYCTTTSVAPNASDTERYDTFVSLTSTQIELADRTQATIAATGSSTATFGAGALFGGLGATVALAPPGGASTYFGSSTVSLTAARTTAGTRKTFGSSTVALTVARTTTGTVVHPTVHGSASVHAYLHITTGAAPAGIPVAPVGRFLVAFDDDTLEPSPTWTRLDSTPHLVTSYTIDRGRQYELDRTDVGRATVQIMDPHGVLDPTNTAGPYYGRLEPLLQATIGRYDPVAAQWYTRYRGFIEEIDYTFDPSQNFNRLTLTLVDIFEILSAVEMLPGEFGDTPPAGSEGQVFFDNAGMQDRILQVLANAGIPDEFKVVFSGNVMLYEATYSAAESAMTAVQEAADAEFPGVSNVYTDRLGRLAVHGRLAKFDPAGTAASADIGSWLFTHWKAGDGQTVAGHPSTTAHIRQLSYNRGIGKIINQALATPVGIADADVAGQTVNDPVSIGKYGIRAWSAQNLLTKIGVLDSADELTETKRFATYYVQNYMAPRNRITAIQFRSMAPGQVGAAANWRLLSQVDISDLVDVTVTGSGGGGFTAEPFFVEGVHEQVQPLNAVYDDVTLTLDLSPQAYWTDNPFPTS